MPGEWGKVGQAGCGVKWGKVGQAGCGVKWGQVGQAGCGVRIDNEGSNMVEEEPSQHDWRRKSGGSIGKVLVGLCRCTEQRGARLRASSSYTPRQHGANDRADANIPGLHMGMACRCV
eukprot:6182945-Pleurochrysis_carterae.AAC.4